VPVHVRYGTAAPSASADDQPCAERTATLRLLLENQRAEVPLDVCPDWVQGNDGALGYYVADYDPRLLEGLVALGDRLPPAEQLALLEEAEALAAAGRTPMASVLDLARSLAASPVRQVAESALALAGGVRRDLVADADRSRYARYLEAAFGPRAEELGWTPSEGESEDASLLRPDVLELLLAEGGDRDRQDEAEALAARWLDDRAALAPDLVPVALEAAARDGDAALHQRLLAALAASEDLRERRWILGALGAFRDPSLLRRSLALLLDPQVDPRESLFVLRVALEDRVNREPTWSFLTESFDALAARLPEQLAMLLAYSPAAFCDPARRAEAEAFFRPRVERFPGSDRLLAQSLETIDQCVAVKEAQSESVAEFLAEY
jgi:alanyl aminopeptidase